MDLDEMKDRWADYGRKLDAIHFSTAMLRADSALSRLSRWIRIELALNVVAVIALGMYTAARFHELRFLLPAVLLQAGAIALIAAGIRQLAALAEVDYSASVVEIQRKLELLRIDRIRTTKWTLLLASLAWTPLLIVTLDALIGLDAYAAFPAAWLIANAAFGVAVIPLLQWMSKRYGERLTRSPFVQQLLNDVAGRSLTKAQQFLGTLTQFETES